MVNYDESNSAVVEGRTIITAETVERPAAERPTHDSIASIAEWLIVDARRIASATAAVDEYAWRLCAAGIPLLRVSLHSGTLHPQFLGAAFVWWRDTGRTVRVMIKHEIANLIPYENNPGRRVREGGETLRRRLDTPETEFDLDVLHELKARGATDYLALPIDGVYGPSSYMITYVSDQPDGFSSAQVADLNKISSRVSVLADMHSQKHIAENVLTAYLGPLTGPRVLAGQIRRGTGEAIAAVLWSSDLRGFTELSDQAPAEQVIAVLDKVFDAQAHAIADHGGEILKFIGDGLLAIFPVASSDEAAAAAARSMAAAREASQAVSVIGAETAGDALRIVIALHYAR
jgi:adenylate cyclase